jgi:hypothetical protein
MPQSNQNDINSLNDSLDDFEATAQEFAQICFRDEAARNRYSRLISEMSSEIVQKVKSGEISAVEGAQIANGRRNRIMNSIRNESSLLGKHVAEHIKHHGRFMDDLHESYSYKRYSKPFDHLTPSERYQVHMDQILASGRSNAVIDGRIAKLTHLSRGIEALSLAYSIKKISESENKERAFLIEVGTLLAGLGGGEAAAYAASLVFGPGAPIFVGAGMFLGSIIAADAAHSYMTSHMD